MVPSPVKIAVILFLFCSLLSAQIPSGGYFSPSSGGASSSFGGVNSKSSNYTAVSSDAGKMVIMNCSGCTLTLPNPPPSATWAIVVQNQSNSVLNIAPNGLSINGTAGSNMKVPNSTGAEFPSAWIYSDGINYFATISLTGDIFNSNLANFGVLSNTFSVQVGITSGMFQSIGAQSVSGCTLSANSGGQSAGKFTAGATACTVTITLPASTNGWACKAQDQTTVADAVNQTANTTTSATISGTVAVSDVIVYQCMGF